MHVAAVGPDRDEQLARTFRTFTGDLERLADWFTRCGIKTIAMEGSPHDLWNGPPLHPPA
jgi:hypothetical protein